MDKLIKTVSETLISLGINFNKLNDSLSEFNKTLQNIKKKGGENVLPNINFEGKIYFDGQELGEIKTLKWFDIENSQEECKVSEKTHDKIKQNLENQTYRLLISSSVNSFFDSMWWKEYQDFQEKNFNKKLYSYTWNNWLKNNNIKMEENKMEQKVVEVPVYPELGEVWVEKDFLENPVGGEVILMCPGFTVDNFTVRDNDCHYTIMATYNDEVVFEDLFQLNSEYAVVKSGWDVQNGVFKLQVKYDLGSDVKNDKSVFKEQ